MYTRIPLYSIKAMDIRSPAVKHDVKLLKIGDILNYLVILKTSFEIQQQNIFWGQQLY